MLEKLLLLSKSSTSKWALVKMILVTVFITNPEVLTTIGSMIAGESGEQMAGKIVGVGVTLIAYLGINKGRLDAENKPSLSSRSNTYSTVNSGVWVALFLLLLTIVPSLLKAQSNADRAENAKQIRDTVSRYKAMSPAELSEKTGLDATRNGCTLRVWATTFTQIGIVWMKDDKNCKLGGSTITLTSNLK